MLSAAALFRYLSLGSVCCMISVKGIFLGGVAKLSPRDNTLCSACVRLCWLKLTTVLRAAGGLSRVYVRVWLLCSVLNFRICLSLVWRNVVLAV